MFKIKFFFELFIAACFSSFEYLVLLDQRHLFSFINEISFSRRELSKQSTDFAQVVPVLRLLVRLVFPPFCLLTICLASVLAQLLQKVK